MLGERYNGAFWFEEDCLASVVFMEHPELLYGLNPQHRKASLATISSEAKEVVVRYFPQYFDPEFKQKAQDFVNIINNLTTSLSVDKIIKLQGSNRKLRIAGVNKKRYSLVDVETGARYTITFSQIFDRIDEFGDF